MFTNLDTYLEIARDAHDVARKADEQFRVPRPDGSGFVVRHDPTRASFKNSLIAIVFAAVYLEALLHAVGSRRFGASGWKSFERRRLEVKLKALGISEATVLADAKRFRESRNDLVHEKPSEDLPLEVRTAQAEAEHAVAFVTLVSGMLRGLPSKGE